MKLALPLALAQAGQASMGLVDTAVVGRAGAVQLAGAALGNAVAFTISIFGIGTLMGVDPLISQALGARDPLRARRLYWQALRVAVVASLFLMPPTLVLAVCSSGWASPRTSQRPPGACTGASRNLRAARLLRPAQLSAVARRHPAADLGHGAGEHHQPVRRPAPGVRGSAPAGVDRAAALDPADGRRRVCAGHQPGADLRGGAATPRHRHGCLGGVPDSSALAEARRIVRVGIPIGLHFGAEVGVFALAGFLAGRLGADSLAAHQIALTVSSVTFTFALGIGNAGSVRVGLAVGAGDTPGARRAGLLAFAAGTAFMGCAALTYLAFPRQIVALLTNAPDIAALAVPLFYGGGVPGVRRSQAAAPACSGAGDSRSSPPTSSGTGFARALPGFSMGGASLASWGSARATAVAAALVWRFLRIRARDVPSPPEAPMR